VLLLGGILAAGVFAGGVWARLTTSSGHLVYARNKLKLAVLDSGATQMAAFEMRRLLITD
jgi:hypothetical protein